MDMNAGDPKEQLEIHLFKKGKCNTENVKKIIFEIGNNGELVFAGDKKVKVGCVDNVVPLVVDSNIVRGWTLPLTDGEYVRNKRKEILIGKEIARRNNCDVGSCIEIDEGKYIVRGIIGRKERSTIWDKVILFDYRDYYEYHSKKIEKDLYILLKTGKVSVKHRFESIRRMVDANNMDIYYEDVVANNDGSTFRNSAIVSITSTILVFFISAVNVINLMIYWMIERKKDLAIMNALGCTKSHILKWTIAETSMFSLIGAVLAITIQILGKILFNDYLVKNEIFLNISFVNILLAVVISEVSAIVTALILTKKSLRFNVKDVLASR